MNVLNHLTKRNEVRAKKSCPFLTKCGNKKSDCPSKGNLKPTAFACGMLKLFAISARNKSQQPTSHTFTQKIETPKLPSLEEVVQQKIQERERKGHLTIDRLFV